MTSGGGGGARSGRDLRLDFFRGFALFCIFIDHTPNDVLSWFTLGSVGVSDAAEVFVLVSGYTAGLVYGRSFDRDGAMIGTARIWQRIGQLYLAHVFLFVVFLAIVGRTPELLDKTHYVDEFLVRDFLDEPALALMRVLTLQFQPVFMDILPLYIALLVVLPGALWGFAHSPSVTLALSATLWAAVQLFDDVNLPAYPWPHGTWPFNPLAWQALFVLGAWLGWRGTGGRIDALYRRPVVAVAMVIAVAGCVIQIDSILEQWYGLETFSLAGLLAAHMSKTDLSALRFANVLALALLAVRLIARDAAFLSGPLGRPFVMCGRHSLHIFCLGILLSVLAYLLLSEYSGDIALQIAVSAAGIAIMVGVAAALDGFGRTRRSAAATRAPAPAGE